MKAIHRTLAALAMFALAGCFPPTTSRPVGSTVGFKGDPSLEGLWQTQPDSDSHKLHARRQPDNGFSVKNPHPLLVAARAAAARDALERARTYAHEVGVELGPVISIREGSSAVIGSGVENMIVTAERAPTRISAGEQSVDAQVTVVWALK